MSLDSVRAIIAKAAIAADRDPESIALVAVSKQQPDGAVDAVLAAGHRRFGENRVQEAQERWTARRAMYPNLALHLIGPLQTNKAKPAVAFFDVIESLDRPKLARGVAEAIQAAGRAPRLLVQVNTGEEPQKAGVAPSALEAFLATCRALDLVVDGLMAIPPVDQPPAPHFALLATLAERHGLTTLSMGMSSDFETAIAFGATEVRIGSALFGARDQA